MRDELVDLELAGLVVRNQVWQLRAALDAAESAAFPDAAGDELECCKRKSQLICKTQTVSDGSTYASSRSPDPPQQHQ